MHNSVSDTHFSAAKRAERMDDFGKQSFYPAGKKVESRFLVPESLETNLWNSDNDPQQFLIISVTDIVDDYSCLVEL